MLRPARSIITSSRPLLTVQVAPRLFSRFASTAVAVEENIEVEVDATQNTQTPKEQIQAIIDSIEGGVPPSRQKYEEILSICRSAGRPEYRAVKQLFRKLWYGQVPFGYKTFDMVVSECSKNGRADVIMAMALQPHVFGLFHKFDEGSAVELLQGLKLRLALTRSDTARSSIVGDAIKLIASLPDLTRPAQSEDIQTNPFVLGAAINVLATAAELSTEKDAIWDKLRILLNELESVWGSKNWVDETKSARHRAYAYAAEGLRKADAVLGGAPEAVKIAQELEAAAGEVKAIETYKAAFDKLRLEDLESAAPDAEDSQ
ncbi:hypothetical protein YB2330_000921 [Saitoella coloradoensis]